MGARTHVIVCKISFMAAKMGSWSSDEPAYKVSLTLSYYSVDSVLVANSIKLRATKAKSKRV